MLRPFLRPWLWAPSILILDFLTKRLVLANEEVLRGKVEVLGDFLRFIYVRNPGSAMGLFPVGRWVLVGVSIAASIFLVWLYRTTEEKLVVRRSAMAAILGGALGNLIDRIFYGGLVVDFVDVGIGTSRFYTFNVADAGVSVGGALLLTPGILTDVLGFSFLLPPTRRFFLKKIRKNLEERLKSGAIQITQISHFPGAGGGRWGFQEWTREEPPARPGEIVIDTEGSEPD